MGKINKKVNYITHKIETFRYNHHGTSWNSGEIQKKERERERK